MPLLVVKQETLSPATWMKTLGVRPDMWMRPDVCLGRFITVVNVWMFNIYIYI